MKPPTPRRKKRSWLDWTLPLVILLAVGGWYGWLGTAPELPWTTDLAVARHQAAAGHKAVLMMFSASWCRPCQMMKRFTWNDPRVKRALDAGFVPVYLDVDRDAVKGVADQYHVRAYPTIIVTHADGKLLSRDGRLFINEGYLGPADMREFLTDAAGDANHQGTKEGRAD